MNFILFQLANKSDISSSTGEVATDQDSKTHSQNSWDEVSSDKTQTTQSLAPGNHSELEDNIEDIPFDDNVDDTLSPQSAFTNKAASKPAEQQIPPSAFKPVAVKAKPTKDPYRVPSAFSSPATHFKPIVIHENTSKMDAPLNLQTEPTSSSVLKETDVVAKLREIKHNLLKHKTSDAAIKDEKDAIKQSSVSNVLNKDSDKAVTPDTDQSTDISSTLKQMQTKGQLPSTDVLATAIAQYLRTHIGGASSDVADTSQTSAAAAAIPSTQNSNASVTHKLSDESTQQHWGTHTQQIPQIPGASMSDNPHISINSSTSHHAASSLPVPGSQYAIPTSAVSTNIVPVPNITTPMANNLVAMQNSATSLASTMPAMSVPFPGGVPSGNVPVQFTLVQDPSTGIMQMVPVPFLPLAHSPSTQSFNPSEKAKNDSQIPADVNVNSNDISHKHLNSPIGKKLPAMLNSAINNKQTNSNTANLHPQTNRHRSRPSNHGGQGHNSQSSSPSPSKDSGICIPQQNNINNDSLMERLLSSQSSQRQEILSRVVRILREEFAEDGLFDTGVEDLAIGKSSCLFLKIVQGILK